MSSSISNHLFSLLHQTPKSLNHLKQLHALLITTNLKSPTILSKLIHHYFLLSPHHPPPQPHLILNHQPPHSQLFLLNTLIKCSSPKHSLNLFANWVAKSSLEFDDHTFIFALGACARSSSPSALYEGEQVHCRAIKLGFMVNLLVSTTAIHFYGGKGCMVLAKKVFDEMLQRSYVTWNALITGYSSQNCDCYVNSVNALMTFKDMLVDCENVRPNGVTMVSVLSAVSQLGNVEIGSSVHGFVVKIIDTPENDVYVGTSLVDMYSKSGCVGSAWSVFGAMEVRNVLTWTAMLTGFAFHGKGKEAMELLNEMRKCNVRPNLVTFTSMLSACCHAGSVEEGVSLFHNMEKEFGVEPQIEHYGCVVDLLGKAGHLKEAYGFILDSKTGSNPVLWRSLLSSCRLHGDVVMGEKVGMILLQLQPDKGLKDGVAHTNDYVAVSNVYALAKRWDDVGTIRGEMRIKGLEIKPGRSAVH